MSLAGFAGAAVLGPVWVFGVEPRWVDWTTQDLIVNGLPNRLHGVRVMQLSDIHASEAVPLDFISRVVDRINRNPPDLLVVTGDMVTEDRRFISGVAQLLGRIEARLGRFAIMGNHDYWTDGPEMSRALERNDIHHLRNESVWVGGRGGLRLIGIDDHWTGNDDLEAAMAGVGVEEAQMLLMHSPDLVVPASRAKIPFALCGHTHGGQVRLPWYGALVTPSALGYEQGRYLHRGTQMYVNRGLGTLDLRVRLNCRPEVHEVRLISP
jgi:uncharacterized protein